METVAIGNNDNNAEVTTSGICPSSTLQPSNQSQHSLNKQHSTEHLLHFSNHQMHLDLLHLFQETHIRQREWKIERDCNRERASSSLNSTFTLISHSKQGSTSSNSSSSCGSDGKTSGGGVGGGSGVRRQHGVGGVRPVPGALKMLHVNSPHALDDRERGTTSGEFSRPLVLIYSHSRFNCIIVS